MSTPEQDREIVLTGHVILEALTEVVGPVASGAIIVRPPARNEDGSFLEPNWLVFPCSVTIDGQTFDFEAWTGIVPTNKTLRIAWQVPGLKSKLPSVIGSIDTEFELQLSVESKHFVRALKEATAAKERLARLLGAATVKFSNLPE